MSQTDPRESAERDATRIKQTKQFLKNSGGIDVSDETATLVLLMRQQEEHAGRVLQKLAVIESEVKTLREAINALKKQQ